MSTDDDGTVAIADQKATLALVLAICGFVVCPLVASVFALIAAYQAKGMFRTHPDTGGEVKVTIALVLGWIGVVVGLGAAVYVLR